MSDNNFRNFVEGLLRGAGFSEKAGAIAKQYERDKQRADAGLIDEVDGARGKFGFDKTNPIPVNGSFGEWEYLSRLRCPCNEPFLFHRAGMAGFAPDGHIIDAFELKCRKLVHRYTLYLDLYHPKSSTKCPRSLLLAMPAGVGSTNQVHNFNEMTFQDMQNLLRQKSQ